MLLKDRSEIYLAPRAKYRKIYAPSNDQLISTTDSEKCKQTIFTLIGLIVRPICARKSFGDRVDAALTRSQHDDVEADLRTQVCVVPPAC